MRISRTIWILLANGTAILGSYITSFFRFRALNNQNRPFWFHFALWAIVPILGIVLEFLDSRFARWVNIGYFTIVSAVMFGWSIFLIHRLQDDFDTTRRRWRYIFCVQRVVGASANFAPTRPRLYALTAENPFVFRTLYVVFFGD